MFVGSWNLALFLHLEIHKIMNYMCTSAGHKEGVFSVEGVQTVTQVNSSHLFSFSSTAEPCL